MEIHKLDIFDEFKKHRKIVNSNQAKIKKLEQELKDSLSKEQKLLCELVQSKLILGKDLIINNPEIIDCVSPLNYWSDQKTELIAKANYLYDPIKNIAYFLGYNINHFYFELVNNKIIFSIERRKYITPSYMYQTYKCSFCFKINLTRNTISCINGSLTVSRITKDIERYNSIFGR